MATRGRISLLGCEIDGAGDSVVLGEGLELARILGNVFAGEPLIRNAAELGRVQVAHTGIEFAAFDPPRPPVRPDPRPATDEVFVVTDFGASPGNDDNTSAFAGALAAAAAAGGGTVYVPAGNYTVAGALTVPSGVEMRGCFDVPHHTISGGSVLMPTGGRGEEDGQPFVSLAERSGLRGLTFWYPEQNPRDIQPYPWTIRALGSDCWLIDLALGNAYQGADLWTYPSDRHLVRYYSGGFFRRGLFVSKSVDGLVEDVQYNPHYMFRLHPSLPNPGYDGDAWPLVCDEYVRGNLEGMVFGACEDELMLRNFLYAAHDGLVFRKDDDRGTTGVVVNHGTDTGSRCLVVEGVGEAGLTMFNSQLVPLGKYEVGAIIIEDDFDGRLALVNSQLWAGNTSGIIGGAGDVLIQQMNTISGLMRLEGGRVRLDSIVFQRDLEEHVRASEGVAEATLIANLGPRSFAVANEAGDACRAIGSASSLPMPADPNTAYEFASGLEAGDPQPIADTIAEPGGGMRTVSDGTCRVVTADAHTGDAALRIAGNADDPEYSYIYFRVFDVSLGILADSVLSYWVRPGNELGRHIGLDLVFAEGGMLRLDGDGPREGGGVHPGGQQVGPVGEWRQVSLPLGRHAGKRISAMMVAYDSRSGGGAFEALIDDIRLSSDDAHSPAMPRVEPTGGPIAAGAAVTITPPRGVSALVSLNGLDPTPESPVYTVPIVLAEPGLVELRIRPVAPDGTLSTHVRTELYEVLPM